MNPPISFPTRQRIQMASAYASQGLAGKAEAELLAALDAGKQHDRGWAYRESANLYLQQARWNDAVQVYQQAVSLAPWNLWYGIQLASAYGGQGMLEKAEVELLAVAETRDPQYGYRAYAGLGHMYRNNGRPNKAIWAYQQALGMAPYAVLERIWLALM